MTSPKLYELADKFLVVSFYALFFLVPLIFTPWNFELFEFNKMMLTYALAVIIVASWAVKSVASGKVIFRRTPLDIFLLLFLASQVASTVFSIDKHTSVWGFYTRSHGGLLSTISYLALYWAFVSNMDVKRTLSSAFYLLSSATIVAVYGTLEHFGASPSCFLMEGSIGVDCWVQDVQNRVFATLGQPNWMAAWLVALSPIAWAFALKNYNIQHTTKRYLWIGLSALFFLALLYTKSRSGLLGFAVASAVFWGALGWTHRRQLLNLAQPFIILNSLFIILILLVGTPFTPTLGQFLKPSTSAQQPSTVETGTVLERGGTESGEIRKVVWQGALDIWRAYPVFGTGVETFAYSYYQFRPAEHNRTSEWEFLYNKAHNEYLNFAATTGTLGLGTYLLLIGVIIWIFTKLITSHQSPITVSLFAGFTSILVTNFFGFSVVPVATLFFLFPAMTVAIGQNSTLTAGGKHKTESIKIETLNNFQIAGILFALGFMLYALARIGVLWYADFLFARADRLVKMGQQPIASIQSIQSAIELRPGEPTYYDKLATSHSQVAAALAENNEATEAAKFANAAVLASDRAVRISPKNVNFWRTRSSVFYRLASVEPGYLRLALDALNQAYELAPTDPKILYNLALTEYRVGSEDRSEELLKETIRLKPDYYDPYIALAELYKRKGQTQLAQEQLLYILENISPEDKEAKRRLEELGDN